MKTVFFKITSLGLFLMVAALQPLPAQSKSTPEDKFRQLEEILPTPNAYRTGSGAPGHAYWQQRVDYRMTLTLDDTNQHLDGAETITYTNNAPDELRYLWLQLDQNRLKKDSADRLTRPAPDMEEVSFAKIIRSMDRAAFDGGYRITAVRDENGKPVAHTIVGTMMRVDLPVPLQPGGTTEFSINWNYPIVNQEKIGARSGYEFFEKDGNYIYELAQFFPRLVAYTDVNGWQHKQFLGDGEFTLEFGDYEVAISVPADHIVAATGVLQNPEAVLTRTRRKRLKRAHKASEPVFIVTPEEAEAAEASRSPEQKTWIFKAENVRDFAFASSRKFIWDAQGFHQPGNDVLTMSFYPKEGNPLWERYSTQAIIHTLEEYAKYTFSYPYPVAISVNGPVGGMEYPMISFNGPRPEEDKTYSERTKYGLISVIIHEVGHNFFPMIVNSDERQWTWMDEGLNSFLQFLAEQSWQENYPSRRGEPAKIVEYMAGEEQVPIMTNSESLLHFGANAYSKPATALNILRETILGRELFDFAFREYARRWKFKRPMPGDLFRSLEDASGVDLDWFWRGWFYSTDHTDISIHALRRFNIDTLDPDVENPLLREQNEAVSQNITRKRNRTLTRRVDAYPELRDFYNENDQFTIAEEDRRYYREYLATLEENEKDLLKSKHNFYLIDFENIGGLVMPIILQIEYTNGEQQEIRIPAEIWRYNNRSVSKMIISQKEIKTIVLDPHLETADVDLENNYFPRRPIKSRFQMFKEKKDRNLMQKMNEKRQPSGNNAGSQ